MLSLQIGGRLRLWRGTFHEAPPKTGPNIDLTDAAGILNEQQRNREDKFRDSWNGTWNTTKRDILAKKFEEAMKKAKDAPAGKPFRDIDLDSFAGITPGLPLALIRTLSSCFALHCHLINYHTVSSASNCAPVPLFSVRAPS